MVLLFFFFENSFLCSFSHSLSLCVEKKKNFKFKFSRVSAFELRAYSHTDREMRSRSERTAKKAKNKKK